MGLLPGDGDLVQALALRAGDDADRLGRRFEDRSLLDMRLEIGGGPPAADRLRAGKTDALEFAAECEAGQIVRPCETVGEVEDTGEHARADHRRRKARTLLVGPGNDLDRRLGLVSEVVEGAQHFEGGHHTVGAVELAAGRLRVEVAASHDGRQARVPAGPAREDVADPIDPDGAASLLAPTDEEPAGLAVEVAGGEPAHPALRRRADLRQLHQARPQPLSVDLQVPHLASGSAIPVSVYSSHPRRPVSIPTMGPGLRGCNPIGIDEHGHDFDMSLSRCPAESRDPCFHKSLSLNVFCDRVPRESPRRLRYGSRPAPGRRDMQRRAMNANWITASFAGTTKCWPKQVSDEQRSTLYIFRRGLA